MAGFPAPPLLRSPPGGTHPNGRSAGVRGSFPAPSSGIKAPFQSRFLATVRIIGRTGTGLPIAPKSFGGFSASSSNCFLVQPAPSGLQSIRHPSEQTSSSVLRRWFWRSRCLRFATTNDFSWELVTCRLEPSKAIDDLFISWLNM